MHSGLIAAGLAAIAAGALIFLLMVWGVAQPASSATLFGGRAPGEVAADAAPSRAWPVVGGLSLAAGCALVGVGMNRWTGRRGVRG
ncbi:MAG: hypothetical protein IT184_11955 [Acidobacteria bacterium]|nr:hypothetical protein [Acidobacteriota bacterium]